MLERFFEGRENERSMFRKLNAIVEALQRFENMSGGPGVKIQRSQGGTSVAAARGGQTSVQSGGPKQGTGTARELAFSLGGVEDTDLYDRSTAPEAIALWVPGMPYYDEATLRLLVRARKIEFDNLGQFRSATAASAPMLITQAEVCG